MLTQLNRDYGKTLLLDTHDLRAASHDIVRRHVEKAILVPADAQPTASHETPA